MNPLDQVKDFAIGKVATAPSPTTSGITLVLQTGQGSLFPDPASGEYNVIVYPDGEQPNASNSEWVRVTAKSSDSLTITREQESSTARDIQIGDIVALNLGAKFKADLQTALDYLDDAITTLDTDLTTLQGDVSDLTDTVTAQGNVLVNVAQAGLVMMFAGDTEPEGWLLCNGQAVSRSTYSDLFAVIGETYGAGDTTTTFNVPNFNKRMPVGKDYAGSPDADFDTVGETGGAKTINLQHSHTTDIQHSHGTHSHITDIQHSHGTHTHTQDAHNHGNVGSTAISTAQLANHRHNLYRVAAFAGGGGTGLNDTTSGTQVTAMTTTGSDSGHTHSTSNATATNQDTTVSLGATDKTSDSATISLGATNKTSDNQLSTTQSIMNPYLVINFIIKY